MSNQIQKAEDIIIGNLTQKQLDTLKATIAVGTTNEQFSLFVQTFIRAGLDPFLNHIFCIVYGNKMSIQIAVEGIMFLAKKVDGYQGMDTQLIYEGDEFKAKRVKDDIGRAVWDVEHEMGDSDAKVIGCYSFAYRDGYAPVFEYMKAKEVEHHLSGTNAGNWKKYYNDFFKKTVAKRAAKRQFGIEISEDDVQMGSGGELQEPTRRDITEEANQMAAEQQQASDESSKNKPPSKTSTDGVPKLQKVVISKFRELEITTSEGREEFYSSNNIKFKDFVNPTIAEMTGLIKVLDLKIEEKNAPTPEDDDLDNELRDALN
jgi:recombination protein RecT